MPQFKFSSRIISSVLISIALIALDARVAAQLWSGEPAIEVRRADLDGDGVIDAALAFRSQNAGARHREVYVYSGATHEFLGTIITELPPSPDFDGNGVVDAGDLVQILNAVGDPNTLRGNGSGSVLPSRRPTPASSERASLALRRAALLWPHAENMGSSRFDLNTNGDVDSHDVLVLLGMYGQAPPQQSLNPCPDGLCLDLNDPLTPCIPCAPDGTGTIPPLEDDPVRPGGGGGDNGPNCPHPENPDCITPDDVDGDGVPNWQDNCENAYNPNQADSDDAGLGDECDDCPTNPFIGELQDGQSCNDPPPPPDDDDDDNGGGNNNNGGGENPPPPPPPPGIECEIEGPEVVAAGAGAVFTFSSAGVSNATVEWVILFGSQWLELNPLMEFPFQSNLIGLIAGESPGLVKIAAAVIDEHGEVQCVDHHTFEIAAVDLDIDSDNDDGFHPPDRSDSEEEIENALGAKVLIVNRADSDEDGIPDYADGFGLFDAKTSGGTYGDRFVPIELSFSGAPSGSTVRFTYSDSDPEQVTRTEIPVEGFPTSFFEYERPSGLLRLWRRNGFESRSIGDFIANDEELDVDDLEDDEVFYIEAVHGSSVAVTVKVTVTTPDGQSFSDIVRVLPFDAVTGLDETEIAGFTIFNGSAIAGTNGNDIVIGTDGDDIIITGSGDDIIVARRGNDIIDAGFGADVVFAYEGHNEIYLDPSGAAAIESGGNGDGNDLVMPGPDGPFTTEQVLVMYRYMYGDSDPWLVAYEIIGGKVQTVKGDGIGWLIYDWSKSDWDWIYRAGGMGFPVIQLEFSLESPMVAATRMRRELTDFAAHANYAHEYREELSDKLLTEDGNIVTFGDNPEAIENVMELRQIAFHNSAAAAAIMSNLYISSVGILSEGADLVLTFGEIIDGNLGLFDGGLALMPYVSAPIVHTVGVGRRAVVRAETGEAIFQRGDANLYPGSDERTLRGLDSGSKGVGWIPRPSMARESRNNNGKIALLLGTPQNTTGLPDDVHAQTVLYLANELFKMDASEYVVMNRSLKTATGRTDLGDFSGWRADVITVNRDGTVDFIEVRSPSQNEFDLLDDLERMRNALPPNNHGTVRVYNTDGEFLLGDPPIPDP